ncbi:MAG: PA14 domain-containing protein [Dehalococcoidia bacterium]
MPIAGRGSKTLATNLIVPSDAAPGEHEVTVNYPDGTSETRKVAVDPDQGRRSVRQNQPVGAPPDPGRVGQVAADAPSQGEGSPSAKSTKPAAVATPTSPAPHATDTPSAGGSGGGASTQATATMPVGVPGGTVIGPLAWNGAYFNNTSFSGSPALRRSEGDDIDFYWLQAPGPGVNSDFFSVRWARSLYFEDGEYEFTVVHDDGVRLLIDGDEVLESWYNTPPVIQSTTEDMTAGNHVVTVEYYHATFDATAELDIEEVTDPGPEPTTPPTATQTSAPPAATATATDEPDPATATATRTSTPVPPTATRTPTPVPATPTDTPEPAPPTDTPEPGVPTDTPQPGVPTNTPTATRTSTPVPPTATRTSTSTPVIATSTPTPTTVAPAPTPSAPTATRTPTSTPTRTPTPVAPTATRTPTSTPTRTPTPLPPTATPTTGAGGTRDKFQQPFASTSIWNMPIGSGAQYASATLPSLTYGAFPEEIVIINRPNLPLQSIALNTADWSGGSRCASQGSTGVSLPVPMDFLIPDVNGAHGGTPNHTSGIIDASGRFYFESQPLTHCSGQPYTSHYFYDYSSASGIQGQDIYGDGRLGSQGGSHLSGVGGTVRSGEWTRGRTLGFIPHAVKFVLPTSSVSLGSGPGCNVSGCRWPAISSDNGNNPGYSGSNSQMKMGSLLAISPSFNCASLLTEPGRIYCRTVQLYGGYVVDTTDFRAAYIPVEYGPDGDVEVEFQQQFGYAFEQSSTTHNWSRDLQTVWSNMQVITNSGSSSVGGGGAPLVPLAPPIGN